MTKNIVYLVGAGASASISRDIPVMANFFEKSLELINENHINHVNEDQTMLLSLVAADNYDIFPNNPARKELASKILKCMTPATKKEIDLRLFRDYKDILSQDVINQIHDFNLEVVFTKAYDTNTKKHERLQYLLNTLFRLLDKNVSQQFTKSAHHSLSKFIIDRKNEYNHTFISYNYDIWLEKALFQYKLWYPNTGNGIGCDIEKYCKAPEENNIGVYNVPPVGTFNLKNNSEVTVLKPHGSLSWVWHVENEYDVDTIAILEELDETTSITYSKEWYTKIANKSGAHELKIIPPIHNKDKLSEWDFLKKIEINKNKAISKADIIVTIGYSMPDTDENIQDEMRELISSNPKERVLVICDKQKFDNEKMKLENKLCNVFQPNNIHPYYDGFDDTFVEKLKGIVDYL